MATVNRVRKMGGYVSREVGGEERDRRLIIKTM
jgi:hypothetical protein